MVDSLLFSMWANYGYVHYTYGYVEFLHYSCESFLQTVHKTLALTFLIGQ